MKQYLRVSPKTKEQARLIPKWIKPWKEYEIIEDQMRHIIDEFGQKTLVLIVQVHLHKFNVQIVKPSQPRWTKDQKAFIDLLKEYNDLPEFIALMTKETNEWVDEHYTLFQYFNNTATVNWMINSFGWGHEWEHWSVIHNRWIEYLKRYQQ